MKQRIDGRVAQVGFYCSLVAGFTVVSSMGSALPAIAANVSPLFHQPVARQAEVKRLYVNPVSGNDHRDSGNALSPLRTITYALEVAQPNTVIILAPGTYSTESGETFPLRLKSDVTIQGNPETRGEGIVISGGGEIDRLNVTLVATDGAGFVGVTVTNPNGYGLWSNSTRVSILNNTFTRNRQDAIAIGGSGSPIVRGNLFIDNDASGISVGGTSRADIRENRLEGADVGLAITDKAQPLLMSNQIRNNEDGVVLRQEAQPLLRGNVITENHRYGVMIRDRSQPNLGTREDPGGNTIRDNDEADVENSAGQMVQAFGNEMERDRTQGPIDFSGGTQAVRVSATSAGSVAMPDIPVRDFGQALSARSTIEPQSRTSTALSPIQTRANTSFLSPTATEIPMASGSVESPLPTLPDTATALPSTGRFSLPPTVTIDGGNSFSEGVSSVAPLPVPDIDIPIGDAGEESWISLLPPSQETSLRPIAGNLRYRVIVEAQSIRQRAAIRAISPEAFSTFLNGQEVVQAGAFRELDRAESLVEQLQGLGLTATIEDMNAAANN